MGGAIAEWSKALLLRENKRKPKREPRFALPAWAIFFNKESPVRCLLLPANPYSSFQKVANRQNRQPGPQC